MAAFLYPQLVLTYFWQIEIGREAIQIICDIFSDICDISFSEIFLKTYRLYTDE